MVIDAWRWRDALQDSRNLETFDGALNLDCALQAFCCVATSSKKSRIPPSVAYFFN